MLAIVWHCVLLFCFVCVFVDFLHVNKSSSQKKSKNILTLTLKIVYLDTTDILQLNYYVQHIGNKKNIYRLCQGDHIKTYGCRYHMTT